MADVIVLFAAALLTLAGAVTALAVARAGRHRRALAERGRMRRQREELARVDDYIRRVSQATTDEQLDRLDDERKHNGWAGLSSRSSSGWPP